MRWRLSSALKIVLPLAALTFFAGRLDWQALTHEVMKLSAFAIVSSLICITIQNFLAAYRWRYIVKRLIGANLRGIDAVCYLYISVFLNQLTLSSVGGDAARIWLLVKDKMAMRDAVGSILIDRVVTLVGLFSMICIGFPVMGSFDAQADSEWVLIGTLSVLAIIGICMLLVLPYIARLLSRYSIFERAMNFLLGIRALLLMPLPLSVLIANVVLGFALMSFNVSLLARAIGVELSFLDCLVLCPPVFLLASLPISVAGWGVRETGMVVALGVAGVGPESAIVISVLLGIVIALGSLPGWLFFTKLIPGGRAELKKQAVQKSG